MVPHPRSRPILSRRYSSPPASPENLECHFAIHSQFPIDRGDFVFVLPVLVLEVVLFGEIVRIDRNSMTLDFSVDLNCS